jgi:hypothetical protein
MQLLKRHRASLYLSADRSHKGMHTLVRICGDTCGGESGRGSSFGGRDVIDTRRRGRIVTVGNVLHYVIIFTFITFITVILILFIFIVVLVAAREEALGVEHGPKEPLHGHRVARKVFASDIGATLEGGVKHR